MLENTRLSGSIDQIELGFVEREAIPKLLMKLGIHLHLAALSRSNTVSIFEIFGVSRAGYTVHDWVHKAELQPEAGRNLDHVAVDEIVIRFNNEQYWLYAAAGPKTNELLHTALELTTNKVSLMHSLLNSARNTTSMIRFLLIDAVLCFQATLYRHEFGYQFETENWIAVEI